MASSFPRFRVFISHAGEDKATIAIPLRQRLKDLGITAFVDERDMPPGTLAQDAMIWAMETADVGVIVLSPEFVARKWPMKELMCFLKRRADASAQGTAMPTVIPVFYRLSISDVYDEPKLNRVDKDGNSLYHQSRFLERMSNGEPEADVAKIRETLQELNRITGVRNDVDASNDSSYLMSTRREILLQNVSGAIREAIRLHAASTVAQASDAAMTAASDMGESDTFRAHFDMAMDTSDLVLDFLSRNRDGRPKTIEGRLLEIVCDKSSEENRTIAVEGMPGVGKTCLLHGLSSSRGTKQRVQARFKGGVYFLKLDRAATLDQLKEVLSTAAEKAGGEGVANRIRSETDWKRVMKWFRSHFEGKQCLFIFDDVWETAEVSSDIVRSLLSLHRSGTSHQSGEENKVVLTTRSLDVASRAGTHFRVDPRDALGPEARAMLFRHSGITPDANNAQDRTVVDEILGRCGGIPLLIAVAGKAVKALNSSRRGGGSVAYHLYAFSLSSGADPSQNISAE